MDEVQDRLDVAIVGMAGVFPGAKNVREFWQLLRKGVEAVRFFTDEELIEAGVDPALVKDPNYVKARAIIEDEDKFDAGFFDLPPREVEMMDPQHRLFLQTAWHALEDAGYDPDRFDGLIGLFGGVSMNTYLFSFLTSGRGRITSAEGYQLSIGNDKDFLTTRVSYKLNLRGPSVAVQTACSTSLVAVHLAYQSLLDYTCDMALAGGVSITIPQVQGYYYQEGMILSKDGHCRAFDHRASGTISGNGVGIVVLKRLDDALRDGDHIYAVIRGSAINNDGSDRVGYTAPSVNGQASVIASALAVADVNPETVTYVEAHGTGTVLGDPIEIAALTQVFREHTDKKQYCAIGSVKTNIGHLDAAAGVAGLIKTALALEHKEIPPSLNFEKPNPKIDFANSPFFVNTELRPWNSTSGTPRRAGVSSFGIGGTNVHVVLEEAPSRKSEPSSRPGNLILLSAKSQDSLDEGTSALAEHLKKHPDLDLHDVAYTLQVGRKHFNVRRMLVAEDLGQAAQKLETLDPKAVLSSALPKDFEPPPVAFMFSGQGSQYVGMGKGLYETEPVFRAELDRCFEIVASSANLDLRGVFFAAPEQAEEAQQRLNQTEVTQPALFAIEYALAKLWMHWGLSPVAMVGHSIGEYVAATLAGVFSLEDALRVVIQRGKLMQALPPGAMLSVPLSEVEVQQYLTDQVSVAAVNSTRSVVLSGPFEAIEQVEKALEEQGVQVRRLRTSHAFHSSMMDPVLPKFTEIVGTVPLREPTLPYLSNTSGTWIRKNEATDPSYYARHLRSAVRFADNVHELLQDPQMILLEVGPGTALATLARRHAANTFGRTILASLPHPTDRSDEVEFLLRTLGRLWLAGAAIDWSRLYEHERRLRVPLPGYAFERKRYWMGTTKPVAAGADASGGPLIKRQDVGQWFYQTAWRELKAPVEQRAQLSDESVTLLFDDGSALSSALANRLEKSGGTVVRIRRGEHFEEEAENSFRVRPNAADDYRNVLQVLKKHSKTPKRILHLWSLAASREDVLDLGYVSLVFLSQALSRELAAQSLDLVVVANRVFRVHGNEAVEPLQWAAYGLSKVIQQEQPQLRVHFIDVDMPVGDLETAVDRLLDVPNAGLATALRGSRQWILEVQHTPLPAVEGLPALLREEGVYVLSGGLGRIGMELAHHLAESVRARLVLLEPYDFPASTDWPKWLADHGEEDPLSIRIRRLQRIQEVGGEVLVLRADVSDVEALQSALAVVKEKFGRVDGLFHLAGVVGTRAFRALSEIGPEDWQPQFAPKVEGAFNLAQVLDALELQPTFVVLQSSLASVLGGLGFGVYAAANAVLDGLAVAQEHGSHTQWVAVDWDGWRFDGQDDVAGLGAEVARLAIEPAEGLETFDRILDQRRLSNVLVSTADLNARIEKWLRPVTGEKESKEETPGVHDRPDLPTRYVAPETELQKQVAEVWSRLLGIATIGIYDDFFDLGGNSLMATQLVSELRETFQVELPLRELFDDPTIAGVCKVIEKEQAERADSEVSRVAEALKQIESLSDEEARRLLEQMRSGSSA